MLTRMRRGVLAAALMGLGLGMAACGATSEVPASEQPREVQLTGDVCLGITQEYAEALGEAVLCDPAADSCAARRPIVIGLAEGSQRTLEGLGHCAAPVNAARTEKLDALLRRYEAAGCALLYSPCLWNQHSPDTDNPQCRQRPDGVGSCNG